MRKGRAQNPFDDANAYRGQVRMAAIQVIGLSQEELERALAFEVEPASGIPAAEAEIAYRQIPDADTSVNVYEVAVRRRERARAVGLEKYLRPTIVVGTIAVLLTAADFGWLTYRSSVLGKTVAERSPLQAQIDAARAQADRTRREAAQIRGERAAMVKAQDDAAKLRAANLNALKCMASACGDRAVLKAMSGEPFAIAAKVISTSAQSAADMMAHLATLGESKGWHLEVGSTTSSAQSATAECEFVLRYD